MMSPNTNRPFSAASMRSSGSEMLRQKLTNAVISQTGRPFPASAVRVGVFRVRERGGALERWRAREGVRSR